VCSGTCDSRRDRFRKSGELKNLKLYIHAVWCVHGVFVVLCLAWCLGYGVYGLLYVCSCLWCVHGLGVVTMIIIYKQRIDINNISMSYNDAPALDEDAR
jgi:hypothetical protein